MSLDCYCDYEPAEFCSRQVRKARKQHKCDECRGTIAAGEQYEHVAGKWDGLLCSFDTCLRCLDLRTWLTNSLPCFCWAHGNMISDAGDAIYDAYARAADEARGLRFGFLRRKVVRDRINAERRANA